MSYFHFLRKCWGIFQKYSDELKDDAFADDMRLYSDKLLLVHDAGNMPYMSDITLEDHWKY